jgi:hypothetical protein
MFCALLPATRAALGAALVMAIALTGCRSGRAAPDVTGGYEVQLTAEKRDYVLAAFRKPGDYTISLDTTRAPPACTLRFDGPIPAGRYRITVSAPATRDSRNFVVSVPLMGGDYSFMVSATGNARYDFAFADTGSDAEHRFTLTAPLKDRPLDVRF